MITVPTVDIASLCPPGERESVLRAGSGFVQYLPGETIRGGRMICVLDNAPDAHWRWMKPSRAETLRPLGCFFLRDIQVSGSGYFFSQGRFVREYAHTSDVGLQWLQRDDYPDNPLVNPGLADIRVEQPVLHVIGPGFPIYGHWLIDFLPRLAIARNLLGPSFPDFVIPLPEDTPDWVPAMMHHFCGIEPAQLLRFSRQTDRLVCDRICVPSFAHTGDYALHSFLRRFYDGFKPAMAPVARRRLCLSRQGFEASTRGVWRILENREAFEALAVRHGYEIVRPEGLGFAEQIALFQSAAAVIGEHGSGMHGAIFAGAGTRVGCFPMSNAIQFRIGALCGHTNIYLNRIDSRTDGQGVIRYTAAETDLAEMVALVDRIG